jgi:hypothetical protein
MSSSDTREESFKPEYAKVWKHDAEEAGLIVAERMTSAESPLPLFRA